MPVPVFIGAQPGKPPPNEEFYITIRSVVDLQELGLSGHYLDPIMVRPGLQGIDLPPVQIFADPLPFDDGSIERGVRFNDRQIMIPIRMKGASLTQLRNFKHDLFDYIDPKRTLVDVIVTQPNGKARYARGRYAGGGEGSYTDQEFGIEWQLMALSFRCFDPYFYDYEDPDPLEFSIQDTSKGFLEQPFLPMHLSSSQVIGNPINVMNPGDADTFGVWRFNGPFTAITVSSATASRLWTITSTKIAGEWIEVDTRPGSTSIMDDTGANMWGALSITDDDLFPISRGLNVLTLAMTGSNSDTRATLTMSPRYRAA
jgi:hypothetical protein